MKFYKSLNIKLFIMAWLQTLKFTKYRNTDQNKKDYRRFALFGPKSHTYL